jgi:predicted tellurium resistance membrane protein TerC
LILIGGGLFLLAKSTHEIHDSLEVIEDDSRNVVHASFGAVIAQIGVIDMVFSLDSVITAIGLVDHIAIMVAAILVSMLVMLVLARPIGQVVEANPTFKMLALAFLILIGSTLVAEGLDFHVPRGYIYFSMAFSVVVELLNMVARSAKKKKAVQLNRVIRPALGSVDP